MPSAFTGRRVHRSPPRCCDGLTSNTGLCLGFFPRQRPRAALATHRSCRLRGAETPCRGVGSPWRRGTAAPSRTRCSPRRRRRRAGCCRRYSWRPPSRQGKAVRNPRAAAGQHPLVYGFTSSNPKNRLGSGKSWWLLSATCLALFPPPPGHIGVTSSGCYFHRYV